MKTKGIVFTFDDDLLSHHEVVAPTFLKYGYRCTFFLNANLGLDLWGCPSQLWEQHHIKSLDKEGHEIGNHTHDHCFSTTESPEFERSIALVDDELNSIGIKKTETFCYPAFISNERVKKF